MMSSTAEALRNYARMMSYRETHLTPMPKLPPTATTPDRAEQIAKMVASLVFELRPRQTTYDERASRLAERAATLKARAQVRIEMDPEDAKAEALLRDVTDLEIAIAALKNEGLLSQIASWAETIATTTLRYAPLFLAL